MKYPSFVFLAFLAYGTLSVVSAAETQTACTMEYAPVCAKVEVQCVRAPCYPIYHTYSNTCMMSSESTAKMVHSDACTAFEEGRPAVLSEGLKNALRVQFDRFMKIIGTLEQKAELAKLQLLDTKITARLAIERVYPMTLEQEMKADKLKYALQFLGDLTQTSIWNLEEEITGKRYLFRDPVKCEGIALKCMAGETFFTDEVGCGCKK